MKHKLLKCTLLVLIACLCTCKSGQANNEQKHERLSSLNKMHSEERRLRACITAIDQRVICKGMSVIDLDKFLNTNFEKEIPTIADEEKYSVCKFGESDFAWRLTVKFNGKGKVVMYYLTNLTQKGYSSTKPPQKSIKTIAMMFQKAKSPSQKLDCAIYAINSRIIKNGTLKDTLYNIFGDIAEEKEISSGRYTRSIAFGSSENSWRLICFGDSNSIFDYYLTNFDWKPQG